MEKVKLFHKLKRPLKTIGIGAINYRAMSMISLDTNLSENSICLEDGVHGGLVLEMEPQELGDQDQDSGENTGTSCHAGLLKCFHFPPQHTARHNPERFSLKKELPCKYIPRVFHKNICFR